MSHSYLIVHCPSCGKTHKVRVPIRGSKGSCKACGSMIDLSIDPHGPDQEKTLLTSRQPDTSHSSDGPRPDSDSNSGLHDTTWKPNISDDPGQVLGEKDVAQYRDWQEFNNRYARTRTIKKGGMGEIIEAFDRLIGRPVAMKLSLENLRRDKELVEQFFKEAKIAAKLAGDGIVPVYDVGLTSDGVLFYTMPIIDGGPLRDEVDKIFKSGSSPLRPFPHKIIARVIRDVCIGVGRAHEHGILHLDLKPDNVLISRTTGGAYVIDWGLAFLLDDKETTFTKSEFFTLSSKRQIGAHSGTGIFGTPGFMAPEQARGKAREYRFATDIFGIGGVLYYCLAGKAPFIFKDTESFLQRMRSLSKAPSPREVSPNTPKALDAICKKCLEPITQDRYQTIQELATDIEDYLASA